MQKSTGNETTDKLIGIEITGNIIHQNWYKTILMDNGKPDAISMLILADIVYWYKPTEIRDENTGATIGFKSKFKADLLQCSHEDISLRMGFTERQVTDSIKRLEKIGVINRVFRTVKFGNLTCYNVMYIQLNFDALMGITFNGVPSHVITCHPPQLNATPPTVDGDTNTEITPSISSEITTEITTTKVVAPADVVVPILKNTGDKSVSNDWIMSSITEPLPKGITKKHVINLSNNEKFNLKTQEEIIAMIKNGLRIVRNYRKPINPTGILVSAVMEGYDSPVEDDLFAGDSPELTEAKNKFKQNEQLFKESLRKSESDSMGTAEPTQTHEAGLSLAAGFLNRIGRELNFNF